MTTSAIGKRSRLDHLELPIKREPDLTEQTKSYRESLYEFTTDHMMSRFTEFSAEGLETGEVEELQQRHSNLAKILTATIMKSDAGYGETTKKLEYLDLDISSAALVEASQYVEEYDSGLGSEDLNDLGSGSTVLPESEKPLMEEVKRLHTEQAMLLKTVKLGKDSGYFSERVVFPEDTSLLLQSPSNTSVKLLKELGRGNFGRVDLVEHIPSKKVYAVKRSLPTARGGLTQEALALLRFATGNTAGIMKVKAITAGKLYLENCNGGSLDQFLKKRGGLLSFSEVMIVARIIANALVQIHENGFVHGDLKIDNIMLREPDISEENVALGDFGTCAPSGRLLSGTPLCSAPELLDAMNIRSDNYQQVHTSPATDVFSFGALLFRLVTGTVLENAVCEDDTTYGEKIEMRRDEFAKTYERLTNSDFKRTRLGSQVKDLFDSDDVKESGFRTLILDCLNPKAEERPDMLSVAIRLLGVRRRADSSTTTVGSKELEDDTGPVPNTFSSSDSFAGIRP